MDYYLVCGSNGCVAPDGTRQAAGVAVGHILYDPKHEYTPPDGMVLVSASDFAGSFYQSEPVPAIPQSVQMWQLQTVLASMPAANPGPTLLDDANALAAKVGGAVQIAWTKAPSIDRTSPNLTALAPQLGLTPEQIDNAFIAASTVTA